jgi:class 3 adenylate cyclase/tetratricopeptide (TPR) repeat protein
MTMDREPSSFDAFFPRRLVRLLDAAAAAPNEASQRGAVLFADISGYTRLAEQLLAGTDEGLGDLTALLNEAFGRYVATVSAYGGEIVHFAGDSLLAYWVDDADGEADSVELARTCAAELVRATEHSHAASTRPHLHCGVGAGDLWAARIGGEDGCWHVVFGGEAVREATTEGAVARRDEIRVGPRASGRVARPGRGEAREPHVRRGHAATEAAERGDEVPPSLPASSLVPRVVLERGASGVHEIGELRQVTAVFARFPGFDETRPDALARMHRLAGEAHRAVSSFSGSPGRWLIDDKGLVFLVTFGVPYNSHADDPLRAVQAALALTEAAWPDGVRCAVGVASGRAFCGTLGGLSRREYVTVGPAMYVAARLMEAGGELRYSGRPPLAGGAERLRFDPAPPLAAKGFTEPIATFFVRRRGGSEPGAMPAVGRGRELAALGEILARARTGQAAVALVQGEAGMGKSCLVAELVEQARPSPGLVALVGRCDSVEYNPTLLPWRGIFRSLLGAGVADDPEGVVGALAAWLRGHPDLEPFGPLLNAVLRTGMPETEATLHLKGPPRADAMLRVMVDFLSAAAPAARLVVLEDCHWMDADSWRLAQAVSRLPGTFIVLTGRPTALPREAAWLREHPGFRETVLQPLGLEDIEQVVRRQLRARSVGSHLVAEVQRRAAGHPLMAIEYLLSLVESSRVTERDGHCTLRGGGAVLESGPPPSMQSLLTSRIDHLDPQAQLVLKVASAIGQTFSSAILGRVSAGPLDAHTLERLVDRQLIEPLPEADTFAFRHSLIREVAYGLMPVSQRRALHTALAQVLEEDGPKSDRALLAHHYYHANDHERTVRHADAAATDALRAGAYREAAYFLDLCLQLGPRYPGWSEPPTVARWHRQLADAHHGLGGLAARRRHAALALKAAGCEPDPSPAAKALAVAAGLAREVASRAGPPLRPRLPPPPGVAALGPDVAKAYRHMVELAYFDNDALGMVWAALSAINAAKRGTPTADLSLAYAQLGGAMGLAGAHPLATRFVQSAIRAAQQADAPHAEGYAHMCNALYQVGLGRWVEARVSVERCQELGKRTRDQVTWGYAEVVLFWTHYYRDEVTEARRSAQRLRLEADRTHHAQHAAWGLRCEALLDVRSGENARAVELLQEARSLLSDTRDANELIMVHGALGLAHLRLDGRNAAIESATLVLQLGGGALRPTNHATLTGLIAAVEVVFELWQREPREPAWRDLTKRGIDALQRYASVFPIAGPSFRYWRGRLRSGTGRVKAAAEDWRRGRALARDLGMVVEERQLDGVVAVGS